MYRKIIAVYFGNHKKRTNTTSVRKIQCFNLLLQLVITLLKRFVIFVFVVSHYSREKFGRLVSDTLTLYSSFGWAVQNSHLYNK